MGILPNKGYQVSFACYTSRPNTLNLLTSIFNVAIMAMLLENPMLSSHAHSLIYFYWHLVASYSDLVRKLLKHILKVYNDVGVLTIQILIASGTAL